jgi:Flp pilus assembly protein CpaB
VTDALRLAVGRYRRLLAALCAAAAALLAVAAARPAAPAGIAVLAAGRDLPGGAVLAAGDLRTVPLPAAVVPAGALPAGTPVEGRQLAGPIRRGEPLTDVRLLGRALLRAGPPGWVAVPVRIADAGSVALLRAGDRVDVLATATGAAETGDAAGAVRRVAVAAPVLAVPTPGEGGEGALVVLAASPDGAAALASAAVTSRLSVTLRGER